MHTLKMDLMYLFLRKSCKFIANVTSVSHYRNLVIIHSYRFVGIIVVTSLMGMSTKLRYMHNAHELFCTFHIWKFVQF